jgi:serine/threonine-protein kinase
VKPQDADLVGQSVGHIRIVDVLSRGGMGTVYVGEDETLHRKVAVKAIRGEHRMHELAKTRFLREARILSQVNHHNICVVHDFIETEDSDYLVLELVPGRSLRAAMKTQLSERQKLDIAHQLLEVLEAVHSAGVIHRDLKPENIMVKPDGRITVLDFGLARSVDEDAVLFPGEPTLDLEELESDTTTEQGQDEGPRAHSTYVKTSQGTVIGTAGYMSPEQANSEPATAASDIYSVGLILQELFTGSAPYEAGLSPMGRVIKAAGGETLPVTGLPADLTALIERLQAFAPGARPSAVDALDQLQHIIDKPRRRRRQAVIAAVWIALAVLATGMTIQWYRASREAERANLEATAAQKVSDFLVDLFEEANPEQARGASLTAEEILERGAERISGELEEQPLTRARLLVTIANVYMKMGLYSEAIPLFEEAAAIRTEELGEDHEDLAAVLNDVAMAYLHNGDHAKAEELLLQALDLRERSLGLENVAVGHTALNLGNLYRSAGRFDEAEHHLQRARAIYRAEVGPDHMFTANGLTSHAILLAQLGRVEEAEPLFRRALAILTNELGEDHPKVTAARNNLAIALKMLGEFEKAEALYKENLVIEERVLGPDHPSVAGTLGNLANLYAEMGRWEEAVPLHLRSLEIRRVAFGPDHPSVARALDNLGGVYIRLDRLEEAEAMCLEALTIREKIFGPEHPSLGLNHLNLARVYRKLGRYEEAEDSYSRSLAVLREAYDPGHRQRVEVAGAYARFLRDLGREEEAREIEILEGRS